MGEGAQGRGIAWRPYGAQAFEAAAREGKPVLLRVGASWNPAARALEEGADRDGAVVEAAARFIPVQADADRRPEVRERFAPGALPVTAVLGPDGVLLARTGVRDAPSLLRFLRVGAAACLCAGQPRALGASSARRRPAPAKDLGRALSSVERALLDSFDWSDNAFGAPPREPAPEASEFLLAAALRRGTPFAQKAAVLSLSAMAKAEVNDPVEGGFFHSCASSRWSEPRTEKLLGLNARLLRAFAIAAVWTRQEEPAATARRTWQYIERTLADPESNLWRGSQWADDEYFAKLGTSRRARGAPPTDNALYVDACAQTVSALAVASACLNEPKLLARARIALDELLTDGALTDGGVCRLKADGAWSDPGRLADEIALASAALDVYCASAEPKWLERAARLGSELAGAFRVGGAPPLVDLRPDGPLARQPGLSASPQASENARAALLLLRLGAATGLPEHRERALEILESVAGLAEPYGAVAPDLGAALLAASGGVVTVELVGEQGREAPGLARGAFGACLPLGATALRAGGGPQGLEPGIVVEVGARRSQAARSLAELAQALPALAPGAKSL